VFLGLAKLILSTKDIYIYAIYNNMSKMYTNIFYLYKHYTTASVKRIFCLKINVQTGDMAKNHIITVFICIFNRMNAALVSRRDFF